jgi:hypothetical protein
VRAARREFEGRSRGMSEACRGIARIDREVNEQYRLICEADLGIEDDHQFFSLIR